MEHSGGYLFFEEFLRISNSTREYLYKRIYKGERFVKTVVVIEDMK